MSPLSNIINNGFTTETILSIFAAVFVIFCATPFHEFSHALVAYKLGDRTAKVHGRLTLNPLAHIDWFGALMIFLIGFGYAKPVPVGLRSFPVRRRKLYMAIIAAAGPISNIIMAFLTLLLSEISYNIYLTSDAGDMLYYLSYFFNSAAAINIALAVFNLIPIPPLDGSKILNAFLPDKYFFKILAYENYIRIALFVLIYIGILDKPLNIAVAYVYYALISVVELII